MNLAEHTVRTGATMLDQREPGWRNRINTQTLDISSVSRCILGQLYDNYSIGLTRLTGTTDRPTRTEFSRQHGFHCQPSLGITNPILDRAWAEEITKGREN